MNGASQPVPAAALAAGPGLWTKVSRCGWRRLLAALWVLLGWCLLCGLALPAWAQAGPSTPAPPAKAGASSTAGTAGTLPALLRYGVLANFPPYQVWPEGASAGGADVDLARELARRADLGLELVRYTDFNALLADLAAGRLQLASAMARTGAREQQLLFTPPYARFQLALVTPAEQPSGGLAPDLAGRSVAVVSGYASEEQVDRLFPLAARVLVNSVREGLQAVRSGRADTFLESEAVISELISREELDGIVVARRFDTPAGQLHLALPLAQADAAQRLSAAVRALPPGYVQALLDAWSIRPLVRAAPGTWQLQLGDVERVAHWQGPDRGPVVGVVGQEAPFASIDAHGQAQGLSVDMLATVLQRMGVTAQRFVALSPAAARDAVVGGEVDVVLGLDESVDLAPFLRFVGPFIEYPSVLIGPPEGAVFSLEQMPGRRLALPLRSAARALVDARYPSVTVVDCADVQACIERVAKGEADATLADVVAAASMLARRPRSDVQIVGAEPQLRRAHSLAVHSRHASAVPLFKRALDHAVATEMQTLKQRWFSRPMREDVLRSLVGRYAPSVAGVLLLLAALWFWHVRRLRAEVQRTRAAQQQAERADQASRRLLAFLAHEVRNSLHAVVAGVDLLRDGAATAVGARRLGPAAQPASGGPLSRPTPASTQSTTLVTALADSARATLHLLNNLIDRDRLDSGQLRLRTEPGRLSTLVEAVVREMTPAAVHRGLQLELRASADHAPLLAVDALRLQQVVRNLLANAIKYGGQGGVELAVQAERLLGAEGGSASASSVPRWRVQVTVSDQGSGWPTGLRDAAGRLASGDAAAAAGPTHGSGLGLPLCRDLARLMGGELQLSSSPGGGAQVTLVFVADEVPAAAAAPAQSLRVQLFEDNEAYALLLQRAFELQGHTVQVAGSVADARHRLHGAAVDLLLSDVHLPDGTAADVMAQLTPGERSADGPTPSPRLLLMTTDVDDLPPALAAWRGSSAMLAKTEDVRQLVARALLADPGAAAPRPLGLTRQAVVRA